MKKKLIVIDGLDASGKETQTRLLEQKLKSNGFDVLKIQFPNYDDPSSTLVKMYLNGEFGEGPDDVNPYAASTFYAADRVASYLRYWRSYYQSGGIVLADRYTTSNAIHQAVKLTKAQRNDFFDWLYDFEFRLLDLPKPDCVIFLDVKPEISIALMRNRQNKIDGMQAKDIHERNQQYLFDCYDCATQAARELGWHTVQCTQDGAIRGIEAISQEVYKIVINEITK